MKKVLCLILVLVLSVCFTACGKKDDNNKNTVDLEYYAKLGQMPEAKYCLGENPDTIINDLKEVQKQKEEEHKKNSNDTENYGEQEFHFQITEGEKNVLIDNGSICYYYNKANKNNGISYIVNYNTAFGFEIGTVILEIQNALPGIKFTEEDLNDKNAFFASYIMDGTVLKAELSQATILFVFQENQLFATAIYNDNWNY